MGRITDLRQKAGLTQTELGNKIGVNQATVSMWETGASKPRADTLIKLSELFGCTIDELLENEPRI